MENKTTDSKTKHCTCCSNTVVNVDVAWDVLHLKIYELAVESNNNPAEDRDQHIYNNGPVITQRSLFFGPFILISPGFNACY